MLPGCEPPFLFAPRGCNDERWQSRQRPGQVTGPFSSIFLLFPLSTVRPPRLLSFPTSELLFPREGRVRAPPGHALSLLDHLSPLHPLRPETRRRGHRGAATGAAPLGQPPTAAAAISHEPSPQARTASLPAPPLPPPSHLADAAGVVAAAAAAAAAVGAAAAASSTYAGCRDDRRSLPLPAAAADDAATTATTTAKEASATAWRE